MAKKRSWFNLVKSFFTSDKHSIQDKKDKRRKWLFFGRFRTRSGLPSIAAPASPPRERTTLSDAEKKQSKHALNVALATAAAAEAAVAAAHAAAEVFRLTGVPQSTRHSDNEREEPSEMKIKPDAPHSIDKCERDMQEFAAITIQTAFRGYLARKALRALKGIVSLQAIIRGRNVRRQALTTLKCLESMVNIQSHARASRMQILEGTCQFDGHKQLHNVRDKIIKMDMNSQRQWDGSILTKEEADAVFLSKKEAAMKRERIKEYSFNHRNSAETERSKLTEKWRTRLDQWVDAQAAKRKELEDLDSVLASNPKHRLEYRGLEFRGKQLKLRALQRQFQLEAPDYSPAAAPRRSYHRKQCSLGEENAFSGSPVVPTYMASTESANAKVRSLSSPKLRPGSLLDAYSESYSPCKNKISLVSSTATEVPMNGRFGRSIAHQQRSPSLKGIAGPIRSGQTSKDLSFDSQCSFRTWGQHSSFR